MYEGSDFVDRDIVIIMQGNINLYLLYLLSRFFNGRLIPVGFISSERAKCPSIRITPDNCPSESAFIISCISCLTFFNKSPRN